MSKKLEIKQRRRAEAEAREAERRSAARRRNLVTASIAVLVIGAVAAAIFFRDGGATEDVGGSIASAGCDDIETFDWDEETDRQHVELGEDVQYETTPGTYGPHWPPDAVSPTGYFEEPIDEESLVHNMEHAQVILYYSPDASDETKGKIEDLVDQEPQATVAAPYEGLEKPFVMAAWGAMQTCDEPAQEAVDAFRERFQGRGPEPLVPTFED